jgi:hypothetical protein
MWELIATGTEHSNLINQPPPPNLTNHFTHYPENATQIVTQMQQSYSLSRTLIDQLLARINELEQLVAMMRNQR